MIAVKIGDGMGNQLFNYACGYAQARRDGDSLVLDISECDNSTLRDFELDKFHLKYDKGAANPSCRTMLNLSNGYVMLLYFVQLRIAKVKPSRKVPLISTSDTFKSNIKSPLDDLLMEEDEV